MVDDISTELAVQQPVRATLAGPTPLSTARAVAIDALLLAATVWLVVVSLATISAAVPLAFGSGPATLHTQPVRPFVGTVLDGRWVDLADTGQRDPSGDRLRVSPGDTDSRAVLVVTMVALVALAWIILWALRALAQGAEIEDRDRWRYLVWLAAAVTAVAVVRELSWLALEHSLELTAPHQARFDGWNATWLVCLLITPTLLVLAGSWRTRAFRELP